MPRLLRRIFHWICLVMLIATIGIGAHSHVRWTRLNYHTLIDEGKDWRRHWTRFDSSEGRLAISILRERRTNREELAFLQANAQSVTFGPRPGRNEVPTLNRYARFLGFYAQLDPKPGGYYLRVFIPYWLIVLLTATPLLFAWRKHRRLRRVPAGHCPHCGYDLRATPNRCPECGQEFAPTPGVA